MMTSFLNQLKAGSRIAFYLLIAFLIIQFWQSPSGSADAVQSFLGAVASFCSSIVEKIAEFIQALTD